MSQVMGENHCCSRGGAEGNTGKHQSHRWQRAVSAPRLGRTLQLQGALGENRHERETCKLMEMGFMVVFACLLQARGRHLGRSLIASYGLF